MAREGGKILVGDPRVKGVAPLPLPLALARTFAVELRTTTPRQFCC